jgi:hypothetical protein
MGGKKGSLSHAARFVALLVALVVVAVLPASDATAKSKPTNWDADYMWRESNCTGEADPINLMFYSAGYRAVSKVEQGLGWTRHEGDTMYVRDYGDCLPSAQRGGFQQRKSEPFNFWFVETNPQTHDGFWIFDEYHVRLWDGRAQDGTFWAYYTGGGTHLDAGIACYGAPGHYGTDFDGARQQVRAALQSLGYFTWTDYWANTHLHDQPCGASPTGSQDGIVVMVELPPSSPDMFKAPASANL